MRSPAIWTSTRLGSVTSGTCDLRRAGGVATAFPGSARGWPVSRRTERARENKLASAQVIERADVVAVMTAGFSAVRSRMLGIPTKAAPLLVGLSVNEMRAKLVEEVEEALQGLANAKVVFDRKGKR